MTAASAMPINPPCGPAGRKNSASSRPVAYPPPITKALKAKPGSRYRWNQELLMRLALRRARLASGPRGAQQATEIAAQDRRDVVVGVAALDQRVSQVEDLARMIESIRVEL